MSFKPIDASGACFTRCNLLMLSTFEPDQEHVKDDICRSVLVMAVSAVDSYMHWLIYDKLADVRKGDDLPPALAKLAIPFSSLAMLADSVVENREKIRPWVQVKNAMQKKLLSETFQSFEQLGVAMSMAGITGGWKKISEKLGEPPAAIKSRLNHIVHRRNQIVHEGDIMRKSRPRHVVFNDISVEQTVDDVDWLQDLIKAMDHIR
ncbi:HEPN domain-containing protein [Pseudomonas fortuita]|uniref:HEPN domain-containing protein n=1 Tax=Pseudomonas fortuita TaxID=3233375 RepID=UPI003C2CD0E5